MQFKTPYEKSYFWSSTQHSYITTKFWENPFTYYVSRSTWLSVYKISKLANHFWGSYKRKTPHRYSFQRSILTSFESLYHNRFRFCSTIFSVFFDFFFHVSILQYLSLFHVARKDYIIRERSIFFKDFMLNTLCYYQQWFHIVGCSWWTLFFYLT